MLRYNLQLRLLLNRFIHHTKNFHINFTSNSSSNFFHKKFLIKYDLNKINTVCSSASSNTLSIRRTISIRTIRSPRMVSSYSKDGIGVLMIQFRIINTYPSTTSVAMQAKAMIIIAIPFIIFEIKIKLINMNKIRYVKFLYSYNISLMG